MRLTGDSNSIVKVGDLVEYKPNVKLFKGEHPVGIVIAENFQTVKQHHRIRVMWLGELSTQSQILSVSENKRITTWINSKHFKVINKTDNENL